MSRRYRYGLNSQTLNQANFFELIPLNYTEVVPGDTVSGSFASNFISDTTVRPLFNRTYMDTFAFYIPFRLLWDQFPEFIADENSGLTPPTVTDVFFQNFENRLVADAPANLNNAPWIRYAYNLVANSFFNRS